MGSAGAAVTTTSTDDCIRISNGTVSIFQDNNNKAVINSDGLTVTQGGNQVGLFAATTKIGNTSNEHIQISGSGLELKDGGTQRFAINSSGVAIGDNFGVDASGNVTMAGNVTAAAGSIGGFALASTTIQSSDTTSNVTNLLKLTSGQNPSVQLKSDDSSTNKRMGILQSVTAERITDKRTFFNNSGDITKFMRIRIGAGDDEGIPAGKSPAADGMSQSWEYTSWGEEPITVASQSAGDSPVQVGEFPFSESIQIMIASGSQSSKNKGTTLRYLVHHPQGAGEVGIDQDGDDEVIRIGKVSDTGGDFHTGQAGNNREFHYGISGSSASTASFGSVFATYLNGDGSNITGLSSAAISSYTNSGNNRIVTSVDASTVNGEANLTFDGSTLETLGGVINVKNGGTQSVVRFYCESSNAHYAQIQAPAHSAFSGNVTLTLPATTDTLVGKTTTDTLTNKTLTSPDINGGTVDDAPIGSSTAHSGSFTQLTAGGNIHAAGDIHLTDDLFVGGGLIDLKNTGAQSAIRFYCESSNAHYQTVLAAPHSEGASNSLTLPSVGTVFATTDGTQTLTNKTLTSPDINTPDIDGGTIDNTPIGGNTAAAGAFTTVTTSDVVLSVTGTEDAPAFQLGSANDGFYHLASGDQGINVLVNNVQEFLFANGGDFHADGDIKAASTTVDSDKRLKTNITNISSSLDKIKKLRPVEFDWLTNRNKHEYGFIAQEVEKVTPMLVSEHKAVGDTKKFLQKLDGTTTNKSVDYAKLTVLLVDAMKEQQKQIDELKQELKEIKDGSTK